MNFSDDSAGNAENPWHERPYVLECEDEDPLTGTWKEKGMIQAADEDEFSFQAFSLDATILENKGIITISGQKR